MIAAVKLEESDESRKLCDNEFGAPATDGDATSLLRTQLDTERGVLDEIYVRFSHYVLLTCGYS